MADNAIDVPMLVLKVISAAAVTTAYQLGVDSHGFINAADSNGAIGAIAMEPAADSLQYFDAMFIGTAFMKMQDSVKAGLEVGWQADCVMIDNTKARNCQGTLLDGCKETDCATNACSTRMHRVFFWGQSGKQDSLWV